MQRVVLWVFMAASAMAQTPFGFVPDNGRLLFMEWRRVLDSPYREAIRKEIPTDLLPFVSSINFIAGIQRVLVAEENGRNYVVLAGKFDLDRIKDQATEDGGQTTIFRGARFLAPADSSDTDSQIALVSPSIVLLGPGDLLKRAITLSQSKRAPMLQPGYDFWLRFVKSTFGILLDGESLRLEAVVQADTADKARELTENARLQNMIAVQNDLEVVLSAALSREKFMERAGNWRVSLENLHSYVPPRPPEPVGPQKVRIIGLDGGTKEFDLPPAPTQNP
ncbi:MAG TPA: hypothetical protein VE621_24080 [Bryobacteraceae bacterium]|nr:hypothetical protein [Bryobacteraceae bacterium]